MLRFKQKASIGIYSATPLSNTYHSRIADAFATLMPASSLTFSTTQSDLESMIVFDLSPSDYCSYNAEHYITVAPQKPNHVSHRHHIPSSTTSLESCCDALIAWLYHEPSIHPTSILLFTSNTNVVSTSTTMTHTPFSVLQWIYLPATKKALIDMRSRSWSQRVRIKTLNILFRLCLPAKEADYIYSDYDLEFFTHTI